MGAALRGPGPTDPLAPPPQAGMFRGGNAGPTERWGGCFGSPSPSPAALTAAAALLPSRQRGRAAAGALEPVLEVFQVEINH